MDQASLSGLFERVARGEFLPAIPPATGQALLQYARKLLEEDPTTANDALHVVAFVGGYQAGIVLRDAVRKPQGGVARMALQWAARCRGDGVVALREALDSRDAEIVLEALGILTRHGDTSGTSRARPLLRHADPRIRNAAAEYLGQVAGASVVPALQGLLADPVTRAAGKLAMDRIEKRAPKGPFEPWPALPSTAVALEIPPEERPPGDLTDQPTDLLRHLARSGDRDRDRILVALRAVHPPALAALVRPMDVGVQADIAVGACRLGRFDGDRRWNATLRRQLGHPVPWVRLEAAQALVRVGIAADLPALEKLADDPVPEVRQAAQAARVAIQEGGERAAPPAGLLEEKPADPPVEDATKS